MGRGPWRPSRRLRRQLDGGHGPSIRLGRASFHHAGWGRRRHSLSRPATGFRLRSGLSTISIAQTHRDVLESRRGEGPAEPHVIPAGCALCFVVVFTIGWTVGTLAWINLP